MRMDRLLRILAAFLLSSTLVLLSCTSRQGVRHGTTTESEPVSAEVTRAAGASTDSSAPPPLVVDTSAPLLLDEPAEGQDDGTAKTRAAIENMACFVCHANYMNELLADTHARANIGCTNCHGPSMAHRNDENNTTPPQIMYAAEKIDLFCRACHTAHDIPPGKVVARWKERGLDKTKPDPDKLVCTDCHGQHRMRIRTVIWDKSTGRLLRTNRGR